MSRTIDVSNKKLILDFGYLQNVAFKDNMSKLDQIIKKLNILNVNNYSDLINFFRGSSVKKGYICLISSNSRKGRNNNKNFFDAVLRIELKDINQSWIEPGTYLAFYLDINLENPTLKIKNIFTTQIISEAQDFETEFGECPIEIVRFEKQISPNQVIRESIVNPYNVRSIEPLSSKFEIEKEKWTNYLSFFGWYLKLRQSRSELYLKMGYKEFIKVEKSEIKKEEIIKQATLVYEDNNWVYFKQDIFQNINQKLNYKKSYVIFVDLLVNGKEQDHQQLKSEQELFITPLSSNKSLEGSFIDKNNFINFVYNKNSDFSLFNLVTNWIGEEKPVPFINYVKKQKTELFNYFQKDEINQWLLDKEEYQIVRSYLEVNDQYDVKQLEKLNLGYVTFVGAGENSLLERMRDVLKKITAGKSKNPYLINYLFNTNLIKFQNYDYKVDNKIDFCAPLNEEQKLAVSRAINTKDIFILQGPPGTGKTQVISEIITQFAMRNKKVMVSSQSNDAIQNVLERIPLDININAVRFINKSYTKQENYFGIENSVANYYKLLTDNINENIDYDDKKIKDFISLRRELEDLIINSKGMHNLRNKIRKINSEIKKIENESLILKDQKQNILKIRIENDNETFQVKNLIKALSELNFNISVQNSKIIINTFEKYILDDLNKLLRDLNYDLETNNICKIFGEVLDHIKSRDSNFSECESAIIELKVLKKDFANNKDLINDLKSKIDLLLKNINENNFFKLFKNISKDFEDKLNSELYNYNFNVIEIGDEKSLDKKIAEANIKINEYSKSVAILKQESNFIDKKVFEKIKKLNEEFNFELDLLDPEMDLIIKDKLDYVEKNLKRKKRKKEFISPLVNDINDFYQKNYLNKNALKEIKYDTNRYHNTVFDNLVNVYALTLTSPDKFKMYTGKYNSNIDFEEVNLKNIDVDVVIIDEASKANLLEMFMALMFGKVLILVGDYRQLPPIINLQESSVKIVNKKYDKHFSFKNIMNLLESSPFKNLIGSNNKQLIQTLKLQYRSHKDIVSVMNYFYGYDLESDESVQKNKSHNLVISNNYKNIIDKNNAVYWVDSTLDKKGEIFYEQSQGFSNSLYNDNEVKIVMKTLLKINEEVKKQKINFKPTVAIINFYSLQVLRMKKAYNLIMNKIDCLDVTIDTVDAFQGRESDYVFVSLVRNPKNISSEYGREFLKKYERINVAFSRAKKLLIIVGAKRAVSELIVDLPDYLNPNIISSRTVYDDIFSMLWSKGATLSTKDILGE